MSPVERLRVLTYKQLLDLVGIGPVLAQRIMDYRAVSDQFQHGEDLLAVKGVGRKRLGDILAQLR